MVCCFHGSTCQSEHPILDNCPHRCNKVSPTKEILLNSISWKILPWSGRKWQLNNTPFFNRKPSISWNLLFMLSKAWIAANKRMKNLKVESSVISKPYLIICTSVVLKKSFYDSLRSYTKIANFISHWIIKIQSFWHLLGWNFVWH